jgi:BlaI family transcriptional regulator, penicillinase repressor
MKTMTKPTDSELEILQILWQRGPLTVRQVHDYLVQDKEIGYTTTLKFMQNMYEKAFLSRTEEGRYHVYQAEINEEETQKMLLGRFIDATFRGSAMKLVMQALGDQRTSQEELASVKEFIKSLEQKQP